MSFLMDELKKAEQALRQAAAPGAARAPSRGGVRPQTRTGLLLAALVATLAAGGVAWWPWQEESPPTLPAASSPPPAAASMTRPAAAYPGASASQQGYAALQAGDVPAARAAYEEILAQLPDDRDALQGLAAVCLREAAAGGDAARTAEARLQALVEAHPRLGFPHYALGNLRAVSGRWEEARQAFQHARDADPGHPDYLFNLAVSLERLQQPQAALEFYRQALAAAARRPASFERTQAQSRLQALTPPNP